EIERLPERYRAVIVLCDLEGCSADDVARRLGCPPATVRTRLARARQRLQVRLTPRGFGVMAALPAGWLGGSGQVPLSLVSSTLAAVLGRAAGPVGAAGAATTLAKEVLKAMLMKKVKSGLVVGLMATILGTSAGFLMRPAAGDLPREEAR